MAPPTYVQRFRQLLGRAFRETGQAIDRMGVKTASLAITKHDYYDDPVIYEDHLSRHRQCMPLLWSGRPHIHPNVAYIAPCATLIGSVHVGEHCSVWYGALLRADECANAQVFQNTSSGNELLEPWPLEEDEDVDSRIDHHGGGIFIGDSTNIQDSCIITSRENHTIIGQGVTVGHLAQIHSSTVGDYSLIGMGSIIDRAVIESEAFVAAGTVVGPGQVVKSGELWVGNPARKLRDLTVEQRGKLHYQSSEYVAVATGQQAVMALGGNVVDELQVDDPKAEALQRIEGDSREGKASDAEPVPAATR